jgi:hypothetical protein
MINQCHALLRRGDGTRHKQWCLASPAPACDVSCPWGHVTRGPLCSDHAPGPGVPLLRHVWQCKECHPCQAKGRAGWTCRALPTTVVEYECGCGYTRRRWMCADHPEVPGEPAVWGFRCPECSQHGMLAIAIKPSDSGR